MNIFIAHMLVLFVINAVIVVGMGLVIGLGGIVALNAGAFLAIGAYTYGIATAYFHLLPLEAFATSLATGLVLGWIVTHWLRRLTGEELVLGTLAIQLITTSAAANLDSATGGIYGLPNITRFGHSLGSTLAVTVVLATVTISILAALYRSPFARLLRAMRDAPLDTELLGRPIRSVRHIAFVCSAGAVAVAGALTASYMTYIDPSTSDVSVSVATVAAVTIGGAGRLLGALAGAAVLTLVPEFLRFLPYTSAAAPAIQQLVFGALIVALMLRRPHGLFGEYSFRD